MKNKLLLSSATATTLAVLVGVFTALFATNEETITRMAAVSNILVLGSVGLFFIGLATPKESGKPTNENNYPERKSS